MFVGVDGRERLGVRGLRWRTAVDGSGGDVARVVPPLEGRDEHRVTQLRALCPHEAVPHSASLRVGSAALAEAPFAGSGAATLRADDIDDAGRLRRVRSETVVRSGTRAGVADVTAEPDLRVAIDHAALDYEVAHDPRYHDLAVAKDVDSGEEFSAFYRLPLGR